MPPLKKAAKTPDKKQATLHSFFAPRTQTGVAKRSSGATPTKAAAPKKPLQKVLSPTSPVRVVAPLFFCLFFLSSVSHRLCLHRGHLLSLVVLELP
jgi:hypothetical protein